MNYCIQKSVTKENEILFSCRNLTLNHHSFKTYSKNLITFDGIGWLNYPLDEKLPKYGTRSPWGQIFPQQTAKAAIRAQNMPFLTVFTYFLQF